MIILILILIVIIFTSYYFFYNKTEPFISSNEFKGAKKGYVFKNDKKGIGYYLDK